MSIIKSKELVETCLHDNNVFFLLQPSKLITKRLLKCMVRNNRTISVSLFDLDLLTFSPAMPLTCTIHWCILGWPANLLMLLSSLQKDVLATYLPAQNSGVKLLVFLRLGPSNSSIHSIYYHRNIDNLGTFSHLLQFYKAFKHF